MTNKEIIEMLECIENHAFCEDAGRDFAYCQKMTALNARLIFANNN